MNIEMKKFKFIDLFSGIGGFHQAMEQLGGTCVFASEIDPYCIKTYYNNYGLNAAHNVREVEAWDIPAHDVLCAGFPCQAFSLAGKRKGFNDDYKGMSRGTLFFDVVRICAEHKPKVIFCENVKGLTLHDGGRTLKIILETLKSIGYVPFKSVLNSKNFGVPQNRERIYIVAFREDIAPK
jgi:DNA (cytosine-5)-methyltransferase 1